MSATYLTYLYTKMRKTGYTVTVTGGEGLKENNLGIQVLVVPDFHHVSPEERAMIEEFYDKGNQVFISVPTSDTYHCLPRMTRLDREERTYQQKVYLPTLIIPEKHIKFIQKASFVLHFSYSCDRINKKRGR